LVQKTAAGTCLPQWSHVTGWILPVLPSRERR
jgi:hypothetical protein